MYAIPKHYSVHISLNKYK